MAENLINEANHQHVHSDVAHVGGQLEKKLAALVLDKKDTDVSLNPRCNPNSQEKWTQGTGDWSPYLTPFPDPKPPATWAAVEAMEPPIITAQSEALAKAANIQRRAIKATKKFLLAIKEDFGSDSEDEPGSDSEYEFNSSDSESEVKPDMDKFFDGLFEKDHKLREYYQNNPGKGNFYCFICQVREDYKGKGMRYKSGLALVQHANTVYKDGGSGAHRALARAVCRVLGWDPAKVPGNGTSSSSSEVASETGDSGTEEKIES